MTFQVRIIDLSFFLSKGLDHGQIDGLQTLVAFTDIDGGDVTGHRLIHTGDRVAQLHIVGGADLRIRKQNAGKLLSQLWVVFDIVVDDHAFLVSQKGIERVMQLTGIFGRDRAADTAQDGLVALGDLCRLLFSLDFGLLRFFLLRCRFGRLVFLLWLLLLSL